VNQLDGMTESVAVESFAVQRRRESRRQEWTEQTKLAGMLGKYLDPADTFWTSLENKPISRIAGIFQKRRGCRSGIPDELVLFRGKPIFVELKSRAGVATRVQKQVRVELLQAGANWWMARSARAALMALHLSGVVFRRQWKPPRLKPWEGPFADPTRRLPQAPDVAARRRAARRRWLARHRVRNATQYATARPRARNNELRGAPRRTRTTTTNRLTPFSATYRNKTASFRGLE
jgi:hypothetical protein